MFLFVPTSPVCSSEHQNSRTGQEYRGNVCPLCLLKRWLGQMSRDESPKEPGRTEEKSCCCCRNGDRAIWGCVRWSCWQSRALRAQLCSCAFVWRGFVYRACKISKTSSLYIFTQGSWRQELLCQIIGDIRERNTLWSSEIPLKKAKRTVPGHSSLPWCQGNAGSLDVNLNLLYMLVLFFWSRKDI